jgi:hypothetical protein
MPACFRILRNIPGERSLLGRERKAMGDNGATNFIASEPYSHDDGIDRLQALVGKPNA